MPISADLPPAIKKAIKSAATSEWPGDRAMQSQMIDDEARAYLAIQAFDFGLAEPHREFIVAEAHMHFESWEDREFFVRREVEAFGELQTLDTSEIELEELAEILAAAEDADDWFSMRRDSLKNRIASSKYIRDVREEVEPIRDLLVRMEAIIGSECYNGSIQNYSSWGVWEGEGRAFRYPISFIEKGRKIKRWHSRGDITAEALMTGHYKFGANELNIFRALSRIVRFLEQDYGLKLPRTEDEV